MWYWKQSIILVPKRRGVVVGVPRKHVNRKRDPSGLGHVNIKTMDFPPRIVSAMNFPRYI